MKNPGPGGGGGFMRLSTIISLAASAAGGWGGFMRLSTIISLAASAAAAALSKIQISATLALISTPSTSSASSLGRSQQKMVFSSYLFFSSFSSAAAVAARLYPAKPSTRLRKGRKAFACRSEEELSELQGTQLLSTTLGVKDYLQSEFVKVEEELILPNTNLFPSPITLDDFIWAFGILRSRAFSQLRGENLVLIPLADLINHSSSITSEDIAWEIKGSGFFSREQVFSLRTPASVKAGEQVLIQYDMQKSNAELALDYGFVESSTDRDTYTLTLEISDTDPFFEDKLDIAESNGLGQTAYFDIVLGHALPPTMLPYLRLVALGGTDAFLLESIFRNSIWGHLELPVSHANEELICRVVRDACRSALSGYLTTVEEDEKLMEASNYPRPVIAMVIRAGEKKVLHQIDNIFKKREMELDSLEYYQERRLKDLGLVGEQGEIIFWESK